MQGERIVFIADSAREGLWTNIVMAGQQEQRVGAASLSVHLCTSSEGTLAGGQILDRLATNANVALTSPALLAQLERLAVATAHVRKRAELELPPPSYDDGVLTPITRPPAQRIYEPRTTGHRSENSQSDVAIAPEFRNRWHLPPPEFAGLATGARGGGRSQASPAPYAWPPAGVEGRP